MRESLPTFKYKNFEQEKDPSVKKVLKDKIVLEDGHEYEGEWNTKTNLRHGKGYQIWYDGSIYEGYWINDKANGRGRLIHADGDIYDGDWVDDRAHGHGTYIQSGGSKYIGQWENDKQNNDGEEIWPDGAHFKGKYKNGKKNGEGHF